MNTDRSGTSIQEREQMNIQTSRTIKGVTQAEWRTLVDTVSAEQSFGWMRAVEESHVRDMHYVFLREKANVTAAACCFPHVEELFGISMPFLEIRCPLGSSNAFFSTSPQQTELLLEGIDAIQRECNTKGVLLLDLKQSEYEGLLPQLEGFSSVRLDDNTYIDLQFSDFDEYLHSLRTSARISIKRTINRAQKRGVTSFFTSDFSRWKQVVHRLQGYTCEQHHNYRWHLPPCFYEALETNVQEEAELVLFFKDDIPLAFALSLNTPRVAQYKFVGVDPRYRKYDAYFLIYYEGIQRALQRNQERIYFGPSTYEFKKKIGCTRESLFGLVKASHPLVNLLLHLVLKGFTMMGKRI